MIFLVLFFIHSSCIPTIYCTATTTDPYRILGVSRNASQKEIQKRYRELCLLYHPDKNSKGEERFKQIQSAYEKVKTQESRRQYDFFDATTRSTTGSDPLAEALFRAFGNPSYTTRTTTARTWHTSFSPRGMPSPAMPEEISFRSIYVQKVRVPLDVLYKGVTTLPLPLKDNLWTRYRAAWRGKVLLLSLYQGLIYSSPIWRASKVAATIVLFFVTHLTVPHPDRDRQFTATLRPGSKGGKTTVRFASKTYKEPEIIFRIEEDRHPIYRRVDNDLHTSVTISSEEAEDGCIRRISGIDPTDPPIELVIPPGKFRYIRSTEDEKHRQEEKQHQKKKTNDQSYNTSQIIRVHGRGWPIRHEPDVYLYGDVIVTVIVKKPSRRHQRKRRKNSAD